MTIDMSQFHQVFFEESFEGLEVMESGLLNMDPGEVDAEQINAIFRAAHSIKGGSGTFGFSDIAAFTHIMETLLDEMRDGRRLVTDRALEVLLRSVDVLREMLTAASGKGDLDEESVKAQMQELEAVLNDHAGEPASGSDIDAGSNATLHEVIGWHLVFRPLPRMMQTGNDPLRILRELASLGDMEVECDVSLLPGFAQFDPEECYLSWNIHLNGGVDRVQIDEVFDWVEDDCDLAVMPLHADAPELSEADNPTKKVIGDSASNVTEAEELCGPDRRKSGDRRKGDRRVEQRRASAAPPSNSIRVDITKIDTLINMVGELVITQSMLSMLGENFHIGQVDRLQEGLAQLERHTREMQESVMQIRMLPISFTFSRFPRLVHDLSTQLGKKIELRMSGENTEVDKTVIEKIGDPLVHLVRNSLDHGIEMPDQRIAAGKPETGVVELNAFHNGGSIVIEIRDDGRGLDADRIHRKAIEKGLIEESDKMSDQQIYELIFQPGFSTADTVNDVSGRGVGMDVVRRNINELGGNIEIESELGRGSAIIIRLPLTLAILDGQIISVGDEIYIVPLISIIESLQVHPDSINLVAGRGEAFKLRDEYLPIVRLHEVFGIEGYRAQDLKDGLLVVVEGDGRRCGILVDDLIGQQQVVIKSLEANYGRVEGVSGATILGDGSVALILDIPGIMRLTNQSPELQLVKRTA
ncbi:MAG: chemotaxis protein CheA [Gammaproteobacteria bacterium]|nr:chemotaxis protein CheA [Gammaproteobacteria bacterium]